MPGTLKRIVAVSGLVLALMFAAAWKGTDNLAEWYGKTNTLEWRVALWQDTVPALKDFWITGSGLGSYDTIIQFYPLSDPMSRPEYAHNDYLQLAVEGGLLVGVPVLVTLAFFIWQIRRRLKQPQDEMTWWIRMGAVAGISGIALQEITDFSLRVPGVAVLFAVVAAIAIHEPAPVEVRRKRRTESVQVEEIPVASAV
jgi:O-antigen ligase